MCSKIKNMYKGLSVQMRASFWFLICAFLQKGISVITTPIFTRLMTKDEFGQFSVFNSWYGILTVIVSLNLFYGVFTQGLVKFDDKQKQYASSLQGLTFVLCLIWTIVYIVFRNFWNGLFKLTTVQMLALLIMIWTNAVFHFWSAAQRVNYKYRLLITVTLIVSILKPSIGIYLVQHAQNKVTARILGLVLVELVCYTGFFFVQLWQGKKLFDGKFWLHALKFNIPLIPHYLSMIVLSSSDRIMIERMEGEGEAGVYHLAYSVSQIMTLFNTALMQTMEPWLYKKIKEKNVEEIGRIATPLFIFIAGVNLMLIALAPEVIAVFAPAEYYEAIWIIPPVAMSVYFMFSYTFFAVFEFYYEKTQYITLATTVGAVLNIILNYIFIQQFGYMAAGYTTLICYIFFSIFHYTFMKKLVRKNLDNVEVYNLKVLLIVTGLFMAIGFLFLFLYDKMIIRYIFVGILLMIVLIKRKKTIELVKTLIKMKTKK